MAFLSPGMTAGLAAGEQGGDIATQMLMRQQQLKRLQQQMQDEDQARQAKALIGQAIQSQAGTTPPIPVKANYNQAQPAFPGGAPQPGQRAMGAFPQGVGGSAMSVPGQPEPLKLSRVISDIASMSDKDPKAVADAVFELLPQLEKEEGREATAEQKASDRAFKYAQLAQAAQRDGDKVAYQYWKTQADNATKEAMAQTGATSRERVAEIGAGARVQAADIGAKAREYGADTVAKAKSDAADVKLGAEQRKAAQTVALVGDTSDKLIENIQELIKDPGVDEAFGPKQGLLPNWAAGAKAVQARQRLEAIQGGEMRAQLAQMRTVGGSTGLGRVLMAELPALQSSLEALNKQMDPDQIRAALNKLLTDVANMKASAVERYTETYKNQKPASGTKGEGVRVYKPDEIPANAKTFELPQDHKYAQEPDGFQTKTKDGLWQKFGNKMILVAPNAAGN